MGVLKDYFQDFLDQVYNILVADDLLNPALNDAVHWIRQLRRDNNIPGEGLPSVNIYMSGITSETHLGIGYEPFTTLNAGIQIRCLIPGDYPSKLLSDLGLSAVSEVGDANQCLFAITDQILSDLRQEAAYRLNNFGSNDVLIVRPNGVGFSISKTSDNAVYVDAVIAMFAQQRVLNV